MRRRPWLIRRAGGPMPGWQYRLIVASNYWHAWRLAHPLRKSALQKDFESGDPERLARVQAVADRVIASLEQDRGEARD